MAEKPNQNIEKRLTLIKTSTEIPQTSRPKIPKIQRVPNYVKNRKQYAELFTPTVVSIGPIHHGDPNLALGEQYKLMWTAQYIASNAQNPEVLYKRIKDNMEELKDLFAADVLTDDKFSNHASEGFDNLEEKLSWMLFVDGCALLQILLTDANARDLNATVDLIVRVTMDINLLENQLPYQVLKLLWRDDTEFQLIETIKTYFGFFNREEFHDESPPHLFHLLRRIILAREIPPNTEDNDFPCQLEENVTNVFSKVSTGQNLDRNDYISLWKNVFGHRFRSIQELREAGIVMKSSKTDICFKHGWFAAELRLPPIFVHERTTANFLNMAAYEMCPDFENGYEICSFMGFMDSLIDNPDDVKTLRSEGILCCARVSDEEVARLFNIINVDIVPDTVKYAYVRAQIDKHYRNKLKIWIAQGRHTYLRNPWTFIAFVAAFIALALTFVQTWFSINPKS